MTAPEPREDVAVAEVLAAHQRVLDGAGSCRCGSWPPAEHDVDWPTHLAEALVPLIAERVMDEHERGFEAGYEQARGDFAERERAAAVEAGASKGWVQSLLAKAWDEGYDEGADQTYADERGYDPGPRVNPYRVDRRAER